MPNGAPHTDPHVEKRINEVETSLALVQQDVTTVKTGQAALESKFDSFIVEWRKSKEHETNAKKITISQIFGMIGVTVTVTASLLVGGMYLVETKVESARQSTKSVEIALRGDAQAQSAQTALQLRGAQDNITATQTGLQTNQRDIGTMSVKLGLVEQVSAQNSSALKAMENYDAHLARQEERTRALQEEIRRLSAPR